MKRKNIEKIAEKMKAIGKAKVEKDEEGNEYIIFDSDLLPCAQKVRAGFLERDLFYRGCGRKPRPTIVARG